MTSNQISDSAHIGLEVEIGEGVVIHHGSFIGAKSILGSNVFIGPSVVLNEPFNNIDEVEPNSLSGIVIGDFVRIEANATIYSNIHIGDGAIVSGGSVVTKNVPPNAIVSGNPAQIIGYRKNHASESVSDIVSFDSDNKEASANIKALDVGNCQLWKLPSFEDLRGALTVNEFEGGLPFVPKRTFMVYDVPGHHVRGEHAHRECEQFLIATSGNLNVVIDNGYHRQEVILDSPSLGLYLAPKIWGVQYKFSPGASLLVFASHSYDAKDYIREYGDFIHFVKKQKSLNE